MSKTQNLQLPYIIVGQAQKEEAHNNALDIIDTAIKSLKDVDTATDLRLDALETFKASTATTLTELDQRLDTLEAGGGGGGGGGTGEVTRLEFEQLQTTVATKADATATTQALSQKANTSDVSQALSGKVDVSTYNSDMTLIDQRIDTLENGGGGGGGGGSGGSSDPSVQVFNFATDPSTIFNFNIEAGKRCLIVNDTNTLLTSDKNVYVTLHSSDNVVNKAYYFILVNNTNYDLYTEVKNYGINNTLESIQGKRVCIRKKSFKQLIFMNVGSGTFVYENDVEQNNPSFLILNNYVLSSDTISLSLKSGINKLRIDNNGTITNEFKLQLTLQSISSNYYQLVVENNTEHDMHVSNSEGYITVNKKSIKLLQVSDRTIFDLSESESETLKINKVASPSTIYKIFPRHAKSIYFKNSYDNTQDVTLYLSEVKTFFNTEVVGEILVFNSTAGVLSVKIESGSGTLSVPAGQLKKMYHSNGNIVALNI